MSVLGDLPKCYFIMFEWQNCYGTAVRFLIQWIDKCQTLIIFQSK